MSDFLKWGCAISIVNGNSQEDFIKAYLNSKIKLNDTLIYSNLICSMIVKFMDDKKEWEGNTSQLLLNLKAVAPQMGIDEHTPGFPKDNVWLGRKITEFENNLKIYGLEFVETDKAKHMRKIINSRQIEKSSTTYDKEYLDRVNKRFEPVETKCSVCGKTMQNFHPEVCEILICTSCEIEKRNSIKEAIKQPCSRCGKETFKKTHSIIEGNIVCEECDPIPEHEEDIVEDPIDEQFEEYLKQQEEEADRIEKELENEITIPEELC